MVMPMMTAKDKEQMKVNEDLVKIIVWHYEVRTRIANFMRANDQVNMLNVIRPQS